MEGTRHIPANSLTQDINWPITITTTDNEHKTDTKMQQTNSKKLSGFVKILGATSTLTSLVENPKGLTTPDSKIRSTRYISLTGNIKDRKGWFKFTYAVKCVFTAFNPFTKNFLMVAKNAQSVMSFNL